MKAEWDTGRREAVFHREEVEGALTGVPAGSLTMSVDDLLAEDVRGVLMACGREVLVMGSVDDTDEGEDEHEEDERRPSRSARGRAMCLPKRREEVLEEMEADEEGREDEDEAEERCRRRCGPGRNGPSHGRR